MKSFDVNLRPKIARIIEKRRKNILYSMYVLSSLIFIVLLARDIITDSYQNFFLQLLVLFSLFLSFYLFFTKVKYEIASYLLITIVGASIIYTFLINNFEHFTPLYVIPYFVSVFFLFGWKKGLFINSVFLILLILIVTYEIEHYNNSFFQNPLSLFNFSVVILTIFAFSFIFEITRVDTYKTLLDIAYKKDMLYNEIHHRVKNNLNIVSSMLSLQAQNSNDEVKEIIQVSKERINSIALVHSMLYVSNNAEKVNSKAFFEKLISNLLSTSKVDINTKINIEQIELSLNEAISLGLILNELFINSMKYAFDNIKEPTIFISLKKESKKIKFIFKDNGKSDNLDFNEHLGLTLVKLSVKQLKGDIKIKNDSGLEYTIEYKSKIDV